MFFVQDQTYLRESEINASEMSNESVEILIKKLMSRYEECKVL